MTFLLLSCSDYQVKGEDEAPLPFDSGDSPPPDTSEDSATPTEDTSTGTGSTTTTEPDPCSWDLWVPDDGCAGWPGTGRDGAPTLDGSFAAPSTTLTADTTGTTLLVPDSTGFSVDDEVFVHARDGRHAFARVLSTGADRLGIDQPVEAPAGSVVQRVPHFRDVTIETIRGSRLVFRACGAVTVNGSISAGGRGWPGGLPTTGIPELGWQGDSDLGTGVQSDAPNGSGGGGGSESCNVHTDGGGGGHATAGTQGGDWRAYSCGGTGGLGGDVVGDPLLGTLHFGGGGGSGYLDTDATVGSYGGQGGSGGGIVYVVASAGISGAGTVEADGLDGQDGYWIGGASPGGGGGGAGGSVRLVGDVGVPISAVGGTGGVGSEAGSGPTLGGTGGEGRVRVDGVLTATSTPAAATGCP